MVSPSQASRTHCVARRSRLGPYVSKLKKIWNSTQLSHFGGKYSLERMLALENYVRSTSFTRVLFVCLGTPVPMILLVVFQEVIPLQKPTDGWQVNYGLWIRVGIQAAVIAYAVTTFLQYHVDESTVSLGQLIVICVFEAVVYTAVGMIIAALWVFPVPFIHLTLFWVLPTTLLISRRIVTGAQEFHGLILRKEQLKRFGKVLSSQLVMVVIYPLYQLLFDFAIGSSYEMPVILLLPVMKLVMKNTLTNSIKHMEDMVPQVVIFTIDFFNAVYVATSMQNASSTVTVTVIVVVDVVQSVLKLIELHENTRSVLQRVPLESTTNGNNLLLAVLSWLQHSDLNIRTESLKNIQLTSCLPLELTSEAKKLLASIENLPVTKSHHHLSTRSSLNGPPVSLRTAFKCSCFPKSSSVQPIQSVLTESWCEKVIPTSRYSGILSETLEMLFTSECLVLSEYLEFVIPILYGNYTVMMANLPNAQYHSEMHGITSENVSQKLRGIFIYGALEFISFVILAVILHRNCGIQALYQLAFVLETQMSLVQGSLVLWMTSIFAYRVVHFGIDFTFRLSWVK
eukprot:jgi/Phyca11/107949/e_gw1.14.527.1